MAVSGCQWISVAVSGCQWLSVDVSGCHWISVDACSGHTWATQGGMRWNVGTGSGNHHHGTPARHRATAVVPYPTYRVWEPGAPLHPSRPRMLLPYALRRGQRAPTRLAIISTHAIQIEFCPYAQVLGHTGRDDSHALPGP